MRQLGIEAPFPASESNSESITLHGVEIDVECGSICGFVFASYLFITGYENSTGRTPFLLFSRNPRVQA